ncbi:MAG: outer membrane protein transport protein [Desulfuromusa sp.]
MRVKLGSAIIALLFIAGMSGSAQGSGFAVVEQSVSGLGHSFSGAVSGEDPSAMFFNPASISLLEGQQATAGLHAIIPSTKFKATTTGSTPVPVLGSVSFGTNNGGDGRVTALISNLYYTHKLNDKLAIGLGINAPFGLATDYDRTWVGRYHAKESDIATININPVVAYRATDQLTLAAGVSAEYADVTLSSMIDGGLVNLSAGDPLGLATPSNPLGSLLAVSNTNYDIFAENTADDWAFGFNLGLMYEFSPDTRIGLAYRSEIAHKLEGAVALDIPTSMVGLRTLFANQNIHGEITLPATASASFYSKVTDKLAFMGDVTWTCWSSFDELTIDFEGTGIATKTSSTTTENWDNTWRYSVGASYQTTESLKLRGGMAFDETPISDEYRIPHGYLVKTVSGSL